MARVIHKSPFGPWNGTITWSELFDGQVWEIRRGEDFDLAASTVADHIRTEYLRVHGGLNIKVDGEVIRVQRVIGAGEPTTSVEARLTDDDHPSLQLPIRLPAA